MYKLLSIILLCLSVLSMSTAHADNNFANPDPNTNPNINPKDWRKTPGALRPAPDKIIPFPKPNKPQKVHVPFDVKKIGKFLGKGGAALLPALAYELLDGAVDYFLDPDNNRVTVNVGASCTNGVYTGSFDHVHTNMCKDFNATISGSKLIKQSGGFSQYRAYCVNKLGQDSGFGTIQCGAQRNTDIPLDELATRLIEAARRGNPDAIRALESWADDEVNTNPDAYRRQLESTDPKVNPNIDPNSETNPEDNPSADVCQTGYTKDKDGVCIPEKQETEDEEESPEEESKPDDGECPLPKMVCDLFEMPVLKDEKVNIEDSVINWNDKATKTYISFSGQCPAPVSIPVTFMGARQDMTLSYEPFCRFAGMIKPAVILGAWISALLIVVGGRAKGE